MLIQIILIATMVIVTFYLLRTTPSARHLALRRLLLLLALLGSVVVILAPGWLSGLAHALGVGRGTDLLLYALIVAFLVYAVSEYKRSVQHSRMVTTLAREIALTRAEIDDAQISS